MRHISSLVDDAHKSFDLYGDEFVQEIWKDKYFQPGEQSPRDVFERVAKAVVPASHAYGKYQKEIFNLMCDGILMPAGRILAGAGTKKNVTLMNCYVMDTIGDDMASIMRVLSESAATQQQGGGIGMDFSTLRPEGSIVHGVGSDASGPLKFMDMWNSMCSSLMNAGARRGAMMAVMRCDHPDIIKFIQAKRQAGRFTNFNVSVLVTDDFMRAVRNDDYWYLVSEHPCMDPEFKYPHLIGTHTSGPGTNGKYVWGVLKARELWDLILKNTYEHAEPGVIFIDRINNENNLQYCETISATNPCGEQPLPPYGACDLGAINLARLVLHPFTNHAEIHWTLLSHAVGNGVRFLDAVIDASNYPLKQQADEMRSTRRIGLGITGLGDMLIQLGLRYGSSSAVAMVDQVMKHIATIAYQTSAYCAKDLGTFPKCSILDLEQRPFINKLPKEVRKAIGEYGLRNGVLLTVAPTGTTSIAFGNVSSGLEPNFEFEYKRRVRLRDGSFSEPKVCKSFIARFYDHVKGTVNKEVVQNEAVWASANDLAVQDHLKVQGAVQYWVDASVSKTINCPVEITYEEFKQVYSDAYDMGCKGCTTYRPSEVRGAILETLDKKLMDATEPKPEPEPVTERAEAQVARPEALPGVTYKIKHPMLMSAIYVTVNSKNGKPWEVFIASKDAHFAEWTISLSVLISKLLQLTGDVSLVAKELREVQLSDKVLWANGKQYSSIVSRIGDILEETIDHQQPGLERAVPSEVAADKQVVVKEDGLTKVFSWSTCKRCKSTNVVKQSGCDVCRDCGFSACG